MNKKQKFVEEICYIPSDEEQAIHDAEWLNEIKINIAKEKLKFVSSADELTIAIAHFAIEHDVGTVVLSRGWHHEFVTNYEVLECNFIADGVWYMLRTDPCNDIKANGGIHLFMGPVDPVISKAMLPIILKSEKFNKEGIFNSGFIRGAVTQRFGLDELGHISDFCKEFIDPALEKNTTMR